MRRLQVRLLFLVLSVVLMSGYAVAQDYLYGIANQKWGVNVPIQNGYINVANGQVHLEFPIASLPGRGSLPVTEKLVYDSRIWKIVESGGSYGFQPINVPMPYSGMNPTCTGTPPNVCNSLHYLHVPNSWAGWRFIAGNETGIAQQNLFNPQTQDELIGWGWTDAYGTTHLFPIQTGTMFCMSCKGPSSGEGYAMDGSGYYMTVSDYASATVFDPDGNQIYPALVDRNGNIITSDANGNTVDTLGRTPVVQSSDGNHIYYDVLTAGGERKRYTVTTETIQANTHFHQSGVSEYSGTLTAIQSITLPDGSSYTFNYDELQLDGYHYGDLTSIVLPDGERILLKWENYLDSYQNQNRWLEEYTGDKVYYLTPSVVTRCSGSQKTGCQERMTVLDAHSNSADYLLTLNNGAWNSQVDYGNYNSQGANTIIASTKTTYDFTKSDPVGLYTGSMWVTASDATTTLTDSGQTSYTHYVYNDPQSGKPSSVQNWDYYSGTRPALPSKETDYTYSTLANHTYILNTMKQLDASGNLITQVQYNYDEAAPTPASGADNLSAAPGGLSRGNLTSTISGIGSTVKTSSTYDTAGQKLSDTDGNGYITNYSYQCSDAYLHTVTYPVSAGGGNLQSQTEYDCNSGLTTSTKDMNGNTTEYKYYQDGNNLGRPQTVNYPDGGSTTYTYPSVNEVDVSKTLTSSINTVTKTITDGFGSQFQSIVEAPEGNISIEKGIFYGDLYSVTTAHLQGTPSPTDGTTVIWEYDVFGRPGKITDPAGNAAYTSYSGSTQTVTDELGHSKQYTYDAFHRVIKVLEPDHNNALAYETDYQYNALDQLVQVDQYGGPKNNSGFPDHKRTFAYDSLGRKIAENIPEKQSSIAPASLTCDGTASGTKWTACMAYDKNGNLVLTTDNAGNTMRYTYDAMNRILSAKQDNGGISYSYTYDGADGYTHSNPFGHLTYETNDNARAGYSYSYDAMGHITNQNTCVPGNCAYDGTGINIKAAYDLAGNMTSLTYPDGRVVSQSYDSANRLTGVQYERWNSTHIGTPYATISGFTPPGQIANMTYGNGVGMASSFDLKQNITSLTYAKSNNILWSKQFAWDKNGSNLISNMDNVNGQGHMYGYDTLNRLTSASSIRSSNTYAAGTVTITGSAMIDVCQTINSDDGSSVETCNTTGDGGNAYIQISNIQTATVAYDPSDTPTTIAAKLVSKINADNTFLVTASSNGAVVTLTSKTPGTQGIYPLYAWAVSTYNWDGWEILSPMIYATVSSPMSGSTCAVPSDGLNEAYTYDPFGNMSQTGGSGFMQSFNGLNQINGYSYDSKGEQNSDVLGHPLSFDAAGLLTSVSGGGETYVYDSQGNRVEVRGSVATDYIYFGGIPIALLNNGTYTDLIYAGNSLLAEVDGSQNALPTYRITDYLGSLAGNMSDAGSVLGNPVEYTPYGMLYSGSTTDMFGYGTLPWDATTALWHAMARQYSPQQGRWMTPDPYDGSYDWSDPQSLNRYAYVNGRPTTAVDPSGLGPEGVIFAGTPVLNVVAIWAKVLYEAGEIFGWWGGSPFHGTTQPRPPMNENNILMQFTHPNIAGALGLPTMADIGCNPICDATDPDQQRIHDLAVGIAGDSQHSFGCIAQAYGLGVFSAASGGAGTNLWNSSQNLVGKARFGSALGGSTTFTSEAAIAARSSSWGSIPFRVPTPIGTPFTGSFAMRSSATLGGAVGRYAPYVGIAGRALGIVGAAYSAYKLWNCL